MRILLALALGAVSQDAAEWPTYHGGFSLDGVTPVPPPDSPVRLWKHRSEGRIEFTPVSGDGRIFVATSKNDLIALDLKGNARWIVRSEKEPFTSPPLTSDRAVFIGTADGLLRAYESATGKERWTYKVGDVVQGTANRVDLPGGKKAIVCVSQSDGAVHCVDLETGAFLWKTGPLDRCDGSAAVGSGTVVMGSCASALHVFSLEKRAKAADIELGGDNQVAGGVAFSGTMAYAGTRSGKLVAVDVAGGKLVWTNADTMREAFATPAVNDKFVVFAADDGKVYGLNRATGVKVWDFDAGGKPSSPVIAGARVVVSAGGSLFILNLETGAKVWTTRVSDEITSPALVGGIILVGADDGTVTAYGSKVP